jgi:serine/threonine protein kinase
LKRTSRSEVTAPSHVTYLPPVRYPRIVTPVSRPVSLIAGTRLGPYEIAARIGVGGMGEVYRATDTNLNRPVAVKVLPASLAADGERLARFQREAQVLASLNHLNIASIYGLERTEGTTALVMELIEGPTLADRIAQGAIGQWQPIRSAGCLRGRTSKEKLALTRHLLLVVDRVSEGV